MHPYRLRSMRRMMNARSPRSPATSPAQYPAGSGVGVSVLFRQPHGFEGFRLAHVELLVDDQPVPERIGPHLPEGHLLSALISNPSRERLAPSASSDTATQR